MDKESLIKALKGGGRTQVDPNIGQVQLNPTLGRYGNYNVVTEPTSKNNSATQLARALMAAPQIVGQFKNIQEAAGIREANELTTEELETRFDKGDVEADGIFSKLFKDQAFQQQVYTRKFDSEVTPDIRKAKAAIALWDVETVGAMSDEGYAAAVQQELKDTLDPEFLALVESKPHMARIHNRAMERLIPNTVEELVARKNKAVKEYTIKTGRATAADRVDFLGTNEQAVRVGSAGSIATDLVGMVKEIEAGGAKDKFHPEAYWDKRQYSIGYGTKSFKGETITKEEASKRLDEELAVADKAVNKYNKKYNWKPHERDALTSFAYNVGSIDELTADGTRSRAVIAEKLLEYNKATEKGEKVKLEGLVKRRKIERDLFLNGYSGEEGEEPDPKDAEYEVRNIPVADQDANFSRNVASEVREQAILLARIGGMTVPEKEVDLADNIFNGFAFYYEKTGNLKIMDAWRESALAGNEPFIDGKPYSAFAEGKRLLIRLGDFIDKEEAANERGTNTLGKEASTSAADKHLFDIATWRSDARRLVKEGKSPGELRANLDELEALLRDPEQRVMNYGDLETVQEDIEAAREQIESFPTSTSLHGEQAIDAWVKANDYGTELKAYSKELLGPNRQMFSDMGLNLDDYYTQDPVTGRNEIDPELYALSDTASMKAERAVYAELHTLTPEARKATLEQTSLTDRYKGYYEKFLLPLVEARYGGPDALPVGITKEDADAAKAQELEEKQGDNDLLGRDGKIQPFPNTTNGLNRALTTFRDDTYDIAKTTNPTTALRRLAMQTSNTLFSSADSHRELGRAIVASPKGKIATHVKVFEAANKIGISMRIHRNGGLFEFTRIEEIPDYSMAEVGASPRISRINHPHSIDFNAPTGKFPQGRLSDIRTSKESIYNLEAIRWYVSGGGGVAIPPDSKLRELAEIYGLDPEEFITNQVELAEKFKLIDPQPKPE